ncbi:hypothetical protein [Kribbella italica]|uniref:SPOR domain-containing protein n=1 Tax=Kribbella italica TaxID=1540520 RepID=A0A7W9MSD7_9ACTN|nr:hypothetical protein [Kribbella italica]MBB5833955.1 hypothetical protein [Kribbella italica]
MADDDHSNEWYYNTKTGEVEPYQGAKSADRLGPYSSREEAARAYEIAKERNESWDNDPKWNDD